MGTVYYGATTVGSFSPDVAGTAGDIYYEVTDVGDFTLATTGSVYYSTTRIGTYDATGVDAVPSIRDARYRTKLYLEAYLNPAVLTNDIGTPFTYALMYAYPDYPLNEEFYADNAPVDLLFLLDKARSTPLLDSDHKACLYEEEVPIIIAAVDKSNLTAEKVVWKAEREIRRICEEHPEGSLRTLQFMGGRTERLGSTVIYQAEYRLRYVRDTTT